MQFATSLPSEDAEGLPPTTQAPSPVEGAQLEELALATVLPEADDSEEQGETADGLRLQPRPARRWSHVQLRPMPSRSAAIVAERWILGVGLEEYAVPQPIGPDDREAIEQIIQGRWPRVDPLLSPAGSGAARGALAAVTRRGGMPRKGEAVAAVEVWTSLRALRTSFEPTAVTLKSQSRRFASGRSQT